MPNSTKHTRLFINFVIFQLFCYFIIIIIEEFFLFSYNIYNSHCLFRTGAIVFNQQQNKTLLYLIIELWIIFIDDCPFLFRIFYLRQRQRARQTHLYLRLHYGRHSPSQHQNHGIFINRQLYSTSYIMDINLRSPVRY